MPDKMKCLICGNHHFECIHSGTRDVPHIHVMKCLGCGMVQLDGTEYNTEKNYVRGGMLENTYDSGSDRTEDMTWDAWVRVTEPDDDRRYDALRETCRGKRVLEFGCGNGGFLRRIRGVASDVAGVELMDDARERIKKGNVAVHKTLDTVGGEYDVVCMFMVIEHLNEPDDVLSGLHGILAPGGILVCETPNAEDALISKYGCAPFEDFTYWSEHVMLFNSDTLERLFRRNGFRVRLNTQIQRYPLSNHLYWLAKGRPGGHAKWKEFNGKELNVLYEKALVELRAADTLWLIGARE